MDIRFSPFDILTTTGTLFVCLLFVCIFTETSAIENDLGARITAQVREQDLFWTSVEASGQTILLNGAARDYQAKRKAGELAAAIWGVSTVVNEIAIIGHAGICQRELDDLLPNQRIAFMTGRAVLAESSYHTLAMVAGIARECGSRLEIAGHTDSRGDSSINKKLSQRRADAVRKYLVQSGASAEQLTATGYGETQPVANNASKSGRQANRRIEFRVLGRAA